MRTKMYWIEGPWKGRFAISARPRGGDWLEDEVRSWKDAGLHTLVSALEPTEEQELELLQERELCLASGIEFISFPLQDRGIPASTEAMRQIAERLEVLLDEGKAVGIHCRQGIGRSALLAGSVLVLKGMDAAKAFETICQARGCPVPDTPEQRDWLQRFAREALSRVGEN